MFRPIKIAENALLDQKLHNTPLSGRNKRPKIKIKYLAIILKCYFPICRCGVFPSLFSLFPFHFISLANDQSSIKRYYLRTFEFILYLVCVKILLYQLLLFFFLKLHHMPASQTETRSPPNGFSHSLLTPSTI